jgi:bile acid-coenzyme A ligase
MSVIDERFREHAADNAVALVARDAGREQVWTWAELGRRTAAWAARIAAAAGPQGIALIEVDNGSQAVLRLLAALRTDGPVAVISRRAPEAESAALCDALARQGHPVAIVRDSGITPAAATGPCRRLLPAQSVLLGTGGSAGRPKIVVDPRMRTVGLRPRGARPSTSMNWRPGQRQLVIGALYHTAALTYFIEAVSDGNTVIVENAFDPVRSLQLIENWAVEWLQLTPYHMRLLADAARGRNACLASVRGMLHLSAVCPAKVKLSWLDLIGDTRVFEMYGATEPVGTTLARGNEWRARDGTVGRGFFTQLRILDRDGTRLPRGEVGDVYMRSGSVAAGCYLDPGQQLRVTPDGFASVSDRGRLDDDGYLYLEPRQASRIQVGGETVYADEVESVLGQHPQVQDAAVIGVPDQRLGEAVVAVVAAPRAQVSARELRVFVRERLARHKVPRRVLITDVVPRSETGKVDRQQVARLAQQDQAAGSLAADGRPAAETRETRQRSAS